MGLQDGIRMYRRRWAEIGQWQDPDLTDCLDFMMTEVAEAIDKRLRLNPDYARNNSRPLTRAIDLGVEIFDAIMMGCIALDLLSLELEQVAEYKLEQMDAKKWRAAQGTNELRRN
ncbi:MAG: hypothetical protein ACE5FD_05305 [Anaerolineae bacterium]